MSALAVTVTVNGSPGAGLSVAAYPQSLYATNPQRGHALPSVAPDGSGITDSGGAVTLSGLSAVDYQLVVVDARGVANWVPVSGAYVGGSFAAAIQWTTPATTTAPVSTGGDTPGGTALTSPWAQREHVHQTFAGPVQRNSLTQLQGTIYELATGAHGSWAAAGTGLIVPGGSADHLVLTLDGGLSWAAQGVSSVVTGLSWDGGNLLWSESGSGALNIYLGGGGYTSLNPGIGNLQSVCVSGGKMLVTDGKYVARYDGSSWTTVLTSSGSTSDVANIASNAQAGGTDVWVVVTNSPTAYCYHSADSGLTWSAAATFTNFNGGAGFNPIAVSPNGYLWVPSTSDVKMISPTLSVSSVLSFTAHALQATPDDQWILFGVAAPPHTGGYFSTVGVYSGASPALNYADPLGVVSPADVHAIAVDGNMWLYGGAHV